MSSRSPARKPRSKSRDDSGLRLHVGGTLIPGKHLYIERPADRELFDLLRQGEYCNILTSRQMGKSSLMAQTHQRLVAEGHHVVIADMGSIGSLVSSDQWYQGLLETMVRKLALPLDVDEWWRAAREATPELRLLRFFREEVAARVPGDKPIILFVDEIDGTLDLPFSDDFFLAMRAMYNQRAITPEYERIVFCPVGVASPNELIKDKRKTPYNIGKLIELRDFDAERDDLSALSQLVGGDATLRQILRFTGGHPYLTVLVAAESVKRKCKSADDVEVLIAEMFASLDELTGDAHFGYIQNFIAQRAEDQLVTLKLYREILRGDEVKDQITPAHIALKLAGLVKRGPNGMLVVRNEIYRRLFNEQWAIRTAEAETEHLRQTTTLLAAAEVHEQFLRRTMSFPDALAHYTSLKNNLGFTGDADELHARFFERLALQSEQLGERDAAILWRLRALSSGKTETRARAANALITPDYSNLRFSFRHPEPPAGRSFDLFAANKIVDFSPDGTRIVTAGLDGTARLWSAETGEAIGQPMRHEYAVLAVAFSPDGRRVVTGSYDNTARLWSAETGEAIGQPMRHENWVRAVAFSPDGRRVLTGSYDNTARLWSAETGEAIGQPMRHERGVLAVAFSPDGRLVVTGSDDNTARLW
ncbi:MAG: AAA-like domain-containing protein, partial [Blastocatellia bacterium]